MAGGTADLAEAGSGTPKRNAAIAMPSSLHGMHSDITLTIRGGAMLSRPLRSRAAGEQSREPHERATGLAKIKMSRPHPAMTCRRNPRKM
eukprot:4956177-Amphidinium_carterae.1